MQIDELGLPRRARNCLIRAGLYTVEDILLHSEGGLVAIQGLGRVSYRKLCERLRARGFLLPPADPAARARSSMVRALHWENQLRAAREALRGLIRVVTEDHERGCRESGSRHWQCRTCKQTAEARVVLGGLECLRAVVKTEG